MDNATISSFSELQDYPEGQTTDIQEHGNVRIILLVVLTLAGLSLAYSLVKFLQKFMRRRHRMNLCSMWYSRRDDEQIDQDRASAQELQLQLNEQELEARKLATRKERRNWYEIYLRPFTMVATKEDFFYAREMENDPPTQQTRMLRQLIPMPTVSSDDEEGREEDDLELGRTIDLTEAVLCNQGDQDAHLYLRLPVHDTCGKNKYVDAHCAICVSDYEEGENVVWSGLECKHAFHDECILAWLSKGKKQCPICRHWFVPAARIEDQKKALVESLRRMSETSTATSTERDDTSESSSADLEVAIASTCGSEIFNIQSTKESGVVEHSSQSNDENSADCAPVEEELSSSRNDSAEITDNRLSPNRTPCSEHEEV